MSDFQERVVNEKNELDVKISKLDTFLNSAIFKTLPESERGRLNAQLDVMRKYSSILGERIAAFNS